MFLRRLRRWLYLLHRWLGIATVLLVALWFVSGLVMMYVGYPSFTDEERLQRLPTPEWSLLRIDPNAAMAAAGLGRYPARLWLEADRGEPVYRIRAEAGKLHSVSARTGHLIRDMSPNEALKVVRALPDGENASGLDTVWNDQWTVAGRYDSLRPLHRFALNDAADTELYVSARSGEVALETTARERGWNWLGAVLHWVYFTELREHPRLWRQWVLWLAAFSLLVAVSGLWIGISRLRLRRPYPDRQTGGHRYSPYRGWALWHHWSGVAAGVVMCTWLLSGWLSLNPNEWFSRSGLGAEQRVEYAGHRAPTFPASAEQLQNLAGTARRLELQWVAGRPQVLQFLDERSLQVLTPDGERMSWQPEMLVRQAGRLFPGVPVQWQWLRQEDHYWYSHHHQRPLPVLRLQFADPDATWLHIDPASGAILNQLDRSSRGYRWWFNALHSFDFLWLLQRRPAWDVVVWLLSLAGLVICFSGAVIGWRRLQRKRFV